jgi:hypothetical protein
LSTCISGPYLRSGCAEAWHWRSWQRCPGTPCEGGVPVAGRHRCVAHHRHRPVAVAPARRARRIAVEGIKAHSSLLAGRRARRTPDQKPCSEPPSATRCRRSYIIPLAGCALPPSVRRPCKHARPPKSDVHPRRGQSFASLPTRATTRTRDGNPQPAS